MNSKRRGLVIRDICFIGIFAAIIVICAQIRIPMGDVPFTLQTWGVTLAGLVLGPKKGTIAVLVYIALGAAGLPVFNGFTGGFGRIAGPTGGFIVTFPVMSLLAGFAEHATTRRLIKKHKRSIYLATTLVLLAGVAFNLTAGMVWFNFVTGLGWYVSFIRAVAPFIPGGVLLAVILPFVSGRIKFALEKAGLVV